MLSSLEHIAELGALLPNEGYFSLPLSSKDEYFRAMNNFGWYFS